MDTPKRNISFYLYFIFFVSLDIFVHSIPSIVSMLFVMKFISHGIMIVCFLWSCFHL